MPKQYSVFLKYRKPDYREPVSSEYLGQLNNLLNPDLQTPTHKFRYLTILTEGLPGDTIISVPK